MAEDGTARRTRTSPIERSLALVALLAIGCSGAGTVLETVDANTSDAGLQDGAQEDSALQDSSESDGGTLDGSTHDVHADVINESDGGTFDACDGCTSDAHDESSDAGSPD